MILIRIEICVVTLMQILIIFGQNGYEKKAGGEAKLLTEKTYSKLFLIRRKETKELLNIIAKEDNYEKRYKLIEAAYGKLLKILQETKSILQSAQYDPMVDKFPLNDVRLIDALTITFENTCLFGEIILHLPDISYRALESRQNADSTLPHWKDVVNWCIKYTRYFNDRIIDTESQQLLWLIEQEINPEKRTFDFENPYRIVTEKQSHKKDKKTRSRTKGPQLIDHNEL